MKKRILSLAMALALCLTLLPTAALAEGATAMPAYRGGNGTKDDPWLISSVEDLQTLASTINNGKAVSLMQTARIPRTGFPEITTVTTSDRQRIWI